MPEPKLTDVFSLRIVMRPVTRCEPPDDATCALEQGSVHLGAAQAKRHALENPGHYVLRDETVRTRYVLDLPDGGE